MKRFVLALAVIATLLLGLVGVAPSATSAPSPPNIVLILTDDQVAGTTQYMPNVTADLTDKGTTFTNVYDNNPLCCPSRATILTGQTSGHNGVWYNSNSAIGGWQSFKPHMNQTIFRWLHDDGYYTGLIGKLMNGYTYKGGDYKTVIPGVDSWDAFLLDQVVTSRTGCDQKGYYSTCYSHNGVLEKHGPSEYSTTTSGDKAVGFINDAPADQPLFLYYAPRAPHLPTTPESKYAHACQSLPSERDVPGFNRAIVNGPAYSQRDRFGGTRLAWFDAHWLHECQTLLSVDDQVGRIIDALSQTGRLDNTLIMFASDNGFLDGAHLWKGKIVPWQQSDQVPLIIRWDALGSQPAVVGDLVTNMDYTATFLGAAGATPPGGYQLDGQSMLPLIGGSGSWSEEPAVLVEHAGGNKVPSYCGVRTNDWLYSQYSTGEEELYDMNADPGQLVNIAGQSGSAATLAQMRALTHSMCDPLPPNFTWSH